MKKILLSLIILMTLCGCSGEKPQDKAETNKDVTSAKVEEKKEEVNKEEKVKDESKFETITICENDYLTFKITDVKPDDFWGYTLKVLIENNSDKDIMVSWDGVSVNGFMCDPFWAKDIFAGKKANSDIYWFTSTFEENGIETVEEIEFTLRVSDNNNWSKLFEETFTINMN